MNDKKVNLVVFDKTLEDIMLSHYPGIIKLEQYEKVITGYGLKYYTFKDLEMDKIYNFLKMQNKQAYMLLKDNKILKISNLKKITELISIKIVSLLGYN